MKRRRELEVFSMSFLDAICCGFGAIILLFIVIAHERAGAARAEPSAISQGLITQYEQELNEIVGETETVRRDEATTTSDLRTDQPTDRGPAARSSSGFARKCSRRARTRDADERDPGPARVGEAEPHRGDAPVARRLRPPIDEYKVGGIPVDSEYIIFLIDTSGSMKQYAWDRVQQQLRETLEVYPTVKGIQIMNDEGEYMFKSYRDEWIPDTPTRRQAIIDALKNWDAFSNSNPREGILAAIDKFYDPEQEDLAVRLQRRLRAGLDQPVVREIDRRNRAGATGERLVRIHAVAFPAV